MTSYSYWVSFRAIIWLLTYCSSRCTQVQLRRALAPWRDHPTTTADVDCCCVSYDCCCFGWTRCYPSAAAAQQTVLPYRTQQSTHVDIPSDVWPHSPPSKECSFASLIGVEWSVLNLCLNCRLYFKCRGWPLDPSPICCSGRCWPSRAEDRICSSENWESQELRREQCNNVALSFASIWFLPPNTRWLIWLFTVAAW